MSMTYRGAQNLIKRGDEPGLRAALEAGLDPNITNQNGWSLLMLAAVEGDLPIGRLLIEKGANIVAVNLKGETPESIAQHRGYDLFVALLKEHTAS